MDSAEPSEAGMPGDRLMKLYERRTAGIDAPDHYWFFLVDDARDDVYAPAEPMRLGGDEIVALLVTGDYFVYTGPVKVIHRRPFVSLRALADPLAGPTREKILADFRRCETFVDDFDATEPRP